MAPRSWSYRDRDTGKDEFPMPNQSTTKPCAYCGKLFHPDNPSVRCCSISCGQRLRFGSTETRFWSKVDKSGGPDACWPWKGTISSVGYGVFYVERKPVGAHRYAFKLANGSIDPKLMVLHACDNPPCCNAKHLSQGTAADNMRQMVDRGRAPVGPKSGYHLHPERYPRGENSFSRQHPERMPRGEENGAAKLTSEQVTDIRARYAAGGVSHATLASHFGVSATMILNIVRRKWWKHVT